MTQTKAGTGQQSTYLDYLPAIYHQATAGAFSLGTFLLAFEQVLTGRGVAEDPGLEEKLDGMPEYFDPDNTPLDFLQWLAGWVGIALRGELTEAAQRNLVANAVSLYKLRGTKRGIEQMVGYYAPGATLEEGMTPLQIGVHSTIGVDTILDGFAPHFFRLRFPVASADDPQLFARVALVSAILDMEKPVHTTYAIVPNTVCMQIAVHSTIGVDTLLGTPEG